MRTMDASQLTAQSPLVYSALPMELKLYSREWCSWCIDAKDYLSEKGYRFHEIDVGKDRQAYEDMKKLSAQTYVPTFVAGDKVLANFDTDQLEKFLNEHQINP
jgi:glutaredoxin 3